MDLTKDNNGIDGLIENLPVPQEKYSLIYDKEKGNFVSPGAEKPKEVPVPVEQKEPTPTIISEPMVESKKKTKATKADKDRKWRNFTGISLLTPPVIISLVSAVHLVDWFRMGNSELLSWLLALSFEVLTISALIAMKQMKMFSAATRIFIWVAVFMLAALQIIGNIYSVFLKLNPGLIEQASVLAGMAYGHSSERMAAILLGAILPLTSLAFLKILANYWINTQK